MFPIDEAIKSSISSTLFDSLEKSLKDIKGIIKRRIRGSTRKVDSSITGLSVFSDGRIIFPDLQNARLTIVHRDRTLDTKIPLSPLPPFDVTCIDDKTVATTTLYNNQLVLVDTENKQVTNTIKTGRCRGITYIQGQILYCELGKGIQAINLSNNKILSPVFQMASSDVILCGICDAQHASHAADYWCPEMMKIDDKIIDILSNITSFGSIKIEKSKSPIIIGVGHEKQAQFFTAVPPRSKSIDDITASLIGEFSVLGKSSSCIAGLSVFPDGRMIIAVYNKKRLVIVHSNGTSDCEVPLSPLQPFDVTCIDDKTVAVTTLQIDKLVIVDMNNKQVTNTIKTGTCRGLTYRHGQLFYCECGKGIQAINISNNKVITIVEDDTIKTDWSYITTSGENIYYTGSGSTVKCYSIRGEKRWEVKDESILSNPTGISVDQQGIVYVISNNSVVLISGDGKNSRTLLTAKDGIPVSLGIRLHTNKLNIVSFTGQVLQFNIA
ncbi:unnamed protein product [Mytilus edulis]|uniref:Uncharacterized protein n=1 Tax=Mytilus edulis TaxID=6550 RepID=A0A8S3UXP1_MYTED|nr:unnamed protein product [Mytilus edulis]